MSYKTSTINARNVDPDEVSFAIDTSLSWDGEFPDVGKGDYLVTIGHYNGEPEQVLVSRRYTTVANPAEAAELALNASAERHGYEQDDEGNLLRMAVNEVEVACPCWVERVDKVTK